METQNSTKQEVTLEDLKNMIFKSGEKYLSTKVRTRASDLKVKLTDLPKDQQEAIRLHRKDEVDKDGKIKKYPQITHDIEYDLSGDSLFRVFEKFAIKKMDIISQVLIRAEDDPTQYLKDNPVVKIKSDVIGTGKKLTSGKKDAFTVAAEKIIEIMDGSLNEKEKSSEIQRVIMTHNEPLRTGLKYFYQGTVQERAQKKE